MKQNSDHSNEFNGETLVILPDNDIAFEMAQLFLHKAQGSVSFLLKDSISSFYSDEIIKNSIQYTYNDMNSLGLPRDIFIEKIKIYNFENIIDTNANFSRFGAFLCLFCNPKVRMGFNYDNSKKYYNVILDSNYQQDLEGTFKMIQQFIKI
ncbi:MAG: hypothetical protein CM15mP33_07770 [Candidatus Neomarinimicrobiota bacterium]|nr:MAG: hypothetical protein CM15mP33_07770 [Candidatus Neomarinimicrobiota bacterium]